MTAESFMGLILAMLVVAIVPGPAVFAVMSASLASGFKRGVYLTAGLVAPDYVFILLAALGFTAVTLLLGEASKYLRFGCAIYLFYIGLKLIFKKSYGDGGGHASASSFSRRSEVLTGLLITLSNPKAILFYVALFPAFVNASQLALSDVLLIMATSTVVFGSVNLAYAWLAARSRSMVTPGKGHRAVNVLSGSILISTGAIFAAKA